MTLLDANASVALDADAYLAEAPGGQGGRVARAKLRTDDLAPRARPLFDAYVRYLDRRDFSPLTVKHYRTVAWQWLNVHADRQPDHDDIDAFVDGCASTYTRVRSYVRWALANGHYTHDPLLRAAAPRSKRGLPRPISETDYQHALDACAATNEGRRMRCWLLLAGKAGLRCKEIAGIRGDDLDLNATPPMLYVSNPKGSSYGHVPLHPDIVAALHEYGIPTRGYLFPGRQGRAFLNPETVSALGSRHFADLGIDATMHQLRHRLGTMLYRQSKDIRLTQTVLRHASLQSTQIYTASDVEEMGGFFGSL